MSLTLLLSTTELKSDGRKHTLKCPECGVLAYYQTQQAKQHIEQRLADKSESGLQQSRVVHLQLPEHSDAQQRFILSVEPFGIESVDGELTTMDTKLNATNDEDINTKHEKEEPRGFLHWIGENL